MNRNKKMKPKALVNKATSDDRTPPSGYILEELAKKSFSVTECDEIESLILKKLSKNKPYVKKKALRVVKYLCDKGSQQWKRSWQGHTDKLKECQQYRGPPDQVYGDSPYKEVRDAAKDAMTAVFAVTQMDNSQLKTRIKGLDGGQQSFGSGGSSSKKKQVATFGTGSSGAYGGPNRGPRGPAPSDKKKFKAVESKGYDPAKYGHKNPYSTRKLDNRTARGNSKRKRQTAGGVWGNDDEEEEDDSYNDDNNETFPGNDSSTNNPTFVSASNGSNRNKRKTGSRSDGRFERKWVDDITKGSGIGIKINSNDLTKYVQQFENLSQDHVLEYLDEKLLGADSWKEQGKALTLLEGLLDGQSSSTVEEYFQQSYESLQSLAEEGKPILKKKAKLLLDIIGVDEDEEQEETNNQVVSDEKEQKSESAQKAPQQQAQKPQQKEENLLDFMNNDPAPFQTQVDNAGDLLDGLTLQDSTSGGDGDTGGGMFHDMEVADSGQAQAAANQNGVSALLPQSGTNGSTQAAQQNNTGGSMLLPTNGNNNDGNETKAETQSSNTTEDFFSGLGMTQEDTNINQVVSPQQSGQQQASGQGGGFSFINGNGNSSSTGGGGGNAQNGQAAVQQNNQQTQQSQQNNQGGSGGFSFVSNTNVKPQGSSMNSLLQQTNQNVNQMNNMIGNMNTISTMMQQAQMAQNQGNTMGQMGSGMNSMNTMNAMGGGMGMNNMNAMAQMGTGMNNMGMGNMGMNNMNNMNMNNMNRMNNMGGMGMQNMQQMGGMGMGMNNMGMNAMGMNRPMGGGMNTMNNMNQGGGMNQNTNGMSQMMRNNMSMFSGTTTAMNQHHNPLNQMRQNDPFAAVMTGGSNAMKSNAAAQNQPKKPKNDAFSSFSLSNLT